MKYLRVKNWERFQHYKDRNPPWIKLHQTLLTDYAFMQLPDATKAHLVCIWILASRNDGILAWDEKWIRVHVGARGQLRLDLLIDAGFLEPCDQDVAIERPQIASRYVSEAIRAIVLQRNENKCTSCGATDDLEIDHIIPISKGGSGDESNLQTLCRPCNRRKRAELSEQVATQMRSSRASASAFYSPLPAVSGFDQEKEFQILWAEYPDPKGRKTAFRHFCASVRCLDDLAAIRKAMTNYKASDRVKRGFIKNGSTWFNEWRDWENHKEKTNGNGPGSGKPSAADFGMRTADDARSAIAAKRQV